MRLGSTLAKHRAPKDNLFCLLDIKRIETWQLLELNFCERSVVEASLSEKELPLSIGRIQLTVIQGRSRKTFENYLHPYLNTNQHWSSISPGKLSSCHIWRYASMGLQYGRLLLFQTLLADHRCSTNSRTLLKCIALKIIPIGIRASLLTM